MQAVQYLASHQIIVQLAGCKIKLTPTQVSLLEKALAWDLGNLQQDSDHLIRYLNHDAVQAPRAFSLKSCLMQKGLKVSPTHISGCNTLPCTCAEAPQVAELQTPSHVLPQSRSREPSTVPLAKPAKTLSTGFPAQHRGHQDAPGGTSSQLTSQSACAPLYHALGSSIYFRHHNA